MRAGYHWPGHAGAQRRGAWPRAALPRRSYATRGLAARMPGCGIAERSAARSCPMHEESAPDPLQALLNVAVFRLVPEPELRKLAAQLHPRRFAAGETLVAEGEIGHDCLILVSG